MILQECTTRLFPFASLHSTPPKVLFPERTVVRITSSRASHAQVQVVEMGFIKGLARQLRGAVAYTASFYKSLQGSSDILAPVPAMHFNREVPALQ